MEHDIITQYFIVLPSTDDTHVCEKAAFQNFQNKVSTNAEMVYDLTTSRFRKREDQHSQEEILV